MHQQSQRLHQPHAIRRRLLRGLMTVLATLWITPSFAIGPTLPLRFDDVATKDPWRAVLILEPEQMRVTRIERQIYANGEMLHREPIEAKFERFYVRNKREPQMRADLPLDSDFLKKTRYKGTLAQKIAIEGAWLGQEGAKPLYLHRWFYFTWKGERLMPISMEEYTRLTDPPEHERTGDAKTRSVFRGRDLKAQVPLPETKTSPALPAGGAVEERLPRDDKVPAAQIDRGAPSDRIDRSEMNEK